METKFFTIGNLTIMEVNTGDFFEIYIRETEDRLDYFRFSFGSDKEFSQEEIQSLFENGYFD